MSAKERISNASESELHGIVGALQIDRATQAARDERIEKELTEMRKMAARSESNIAKLANMLTQFVSESKQVKSEVARIESTTDKLVDRMTIVEISGKERETKIKMLMFGAGAITTAVITWVITSFKG